MARNVSMVSQGFSYPNTGAMTIGTTAVKVSNSSRVLSTGIQIIADAGNAGDVYVGSRPNLTTEATAATSGVKLPASATILYPAHLESDVYLIASEADQKVTFVSF